MITTTAQPSATDLSRFIRQVNSFPVSAAQLSKIAKDKGAPRQVVSFYQTFAPDRKFTDREDLAATSEQVEIMRQSELQMPKEEERAPEDD